MSLADVIVGSTLAGIAGIIGLSLFVVVSEQSTITTTDATLADTARVALNQIASDLRTADSPQALPLYTTGRFETYGPGEIVFYSNRDTGSRAYSDSRTPPVRVSFKAESDPSTAGKPADQQLVNLVMRVWKPTTVYGTAGRPYPSPYNYAANYPTAPTSTTVLVRGLANSRKPTPTGTWTEPLFTYCTSARDVGDTCVPATASPSQIASVLVRLKIDDATGTPGSTQYVPAKWLTTRVAINGSVTPGSAAGVTP
ncbi:hypothetical protein GCM10027265_36800 [Jatrophihabitans fulvus]